MKKALFIIVAAAVATVACNKFDNEAAQGGRKAVKFTAENISNYSFKSTVAPDAEGASTVGIFASDLGATNVEATISGTALNPSTTIYWQLGQTASSAFAAVYPWASGRNATTFEYGIPEDQSSADTFTYQDNFMTAAKTASPSDESVAFNFSHPFAKIIIDITNNLGGDVVSKVEVGGLKMNATALDVTTNPATITAEDATATVTANAVTANSQYALVTLPQSATPEITVTTQQGSVYKFNLAASYTFTAGKSATAAITLNPQDGSGNGSNRVAANFSFTVSAWEAGTAATVTAGDVTVGDYWYIIGTVNGCTEWDTDYPMALGADGKWTATITYSEEGAADADKGFKIHKLGDDVWANQLGMSNGDENTYVNIGYTYDLASSNNKNIRFEDAGTYDLTLDGTKLSVVKQ